MATVGCIVVYIDDVNGYTDWRALSSVLVGSRNIDDVARYIFVIQRSDISEYQFIDWFLRIYLKVSGQVTWVVKKVNCCQCQMLVEHTQIQNITQQSISELPFTLRTCEGCQSGVRKSARKFKQVAKTRRFHAYTNASWWTCVNLRRVAKRWKTSVDLRSNLSSTKVNASYRKSTQVGGQKTRKLNASPKLKLTCADLRVRWASGLERRTQEKQETLGNGGKESQDWC